MLKKMNKGIWILLGILFPIVWVVYWYRNEGRWMVGRPPHRQAKLREEYKRLVWSQKMRNLERKEQRRRKRVVARRKKDGTAWEEIMR